jgi:ribonuclease HI
MPWAWALLRGTRVLARATAAGAFVREPDGRVEIRYGLGHSKAYRAAERNLEPVAEPLVADDAFAGSTGAVPPSPSRAKRQTGTPAIHAESYDGWIAYTDGACSGNPGPAGSGVVLVAPGGEATVEGYEYLGTSTNNVGELTAILRAIEWAPATGPLLVYTDSQYAIGVLQKGWKAKANPELIAHTKRRIAERGQVRLEYVRGHAGHALNERADELARRAVSTRATKRAELPEG